MQTKIVNLLLQAEEKHQIKIHYACESGSRAWGFPSPDSDYDFRFLYQHDRNWYLSIAEKMKIKKKSPGMGRLKKRLSDSCEKSFVGCRKLAKDH